MRTPPVPEESQARCLRPGACALLACLALAGAAAGAPEGSAVPPGRGALIIAGGGDLPPPILERFVALAGGPGRARILVLPMASASPASGPEQAEEFRGLGAEARSVALDRPQALAPESAKHLEGITGVWFTGGDQSRVTAAIGETPFEEALHRFHRSGGVIGGSSAGAALMSRLMITGEERPNEGAREGDPLFDDIVRGRVVAARGLGFLPGAIVDQHFVARSRHNRLISLVLENPGEIGVGIDERTALEVGPDGIWRVLGEGAAVVYDARRALVPASGPLAGAGVRMHVLPAGSTFAPRKGRAALPPLAGPARGAPAEPAADPPAGPVADPPPARPQAQRAALDVLIAGGRVIDPASGVDKVADVGVSGGRIVFVGDSPPGAGARRRLDARGKVVAPGFIDILAGTHREGDTYKVRDGVTTVISTHGGPVDFEGWLKEEEKRGPLVNYGTFVGHGSLRTAVGLEDNDRPAAPEQVARMAAMAGRALERGAIGVGFGLEYTPGASGQEVIALAAAAAARNASVHAHIRVAHLLDPFQGINELIAASAATGARVHVVHIGSIAIHRQKEALDLLDRARARGIDIAADVYPYDAWMTRLESAIFDDGWREKYSLDYGDLVWVATGERLTEETFRARRAEGGYVACHQIPEEEIDLALRHPAVSVASDGTIGDGPAQHPRGAGTFARVLGRYVRERGVLTLAEALSKMTLGPARRLEEGAPALRRKGRLAPGMDADITVFDPGVILDRATYENPRQPSAGIEHVLINGTIVVEKGRLLEAFRDGSGGPGRPILSTER